MTRNTCWRARHLFQKALCGTVGARAPEVKVCQMQFMSCSSQHVCKVLHTLWKCTCLYMIHAFGIHITCMFMKDEMSITDELVREHCSRPKNGANMERTWCEHWSPTKSGANMVRTPVRARTVFANTVRALCKPCREHGANRVFAPLLWAQYFEDMRITLGVTLQTTANRVRSCGYHWRVCTPKQTNTFFTLATLRQTQKLPCQRKAVT